MFDVLLLGTVLYHDMTAFGRWAMACGDRRRLRQHGGVFNSAAVEHRTF